MATPFTLTPQPIRVTAAARQPIYLSLDISGYDACDIEAICMVEGTATNAALNLVTGMQTATDDGWVIPGANFAPISGTGQQVARVTVASGLLQYLRWDVSSLGGASALTFFLRGIAREAGTAAAGPGTAATIAVSYAAGASQNDSTIGLDSTRLGLRLRDNATPIAGNLFAVQNSAGSTTYLGVTPSAVTAGVDILPATDNARSLGSFSTRFSYLNTLNVSSGQGSTLWLRANGNVRTTITDTSSLTLTSGMVDGASAVGHILDTTTAWSNSGAKLLSVRTNGTEKFHISPNSGPAGAYFGFNSSVGFGHQPSGNQMGFKGGIFYPIDSNTYLGQYNTPWWRVHGYSYYSQSKGVSYAASNLIFDSTGVTGSPSSQGEVMSVTLTGNVSSWSIARSGGGNSAGQRVMIIFIQDATGNRTLSGAASDIKLNGALTLSTGANKRDTVVFMDDGVNWIEIARSLNN